MRGARIGRYTLLREIGRGGMGSVYEARHEELHKAVAIKTLKPEFAIQPAIVERFLREGRAASRVRHRHAIEMFDVGEEEGVVFLAMELLEGEDLAHSTTVPGLPQGWCWIDCGRSAAGHIRLAAARAAG